MTVRLDGDVIRLEGDCHVEQAEHLVQLLEATPGRTVDIALCRHLHAALAQVLLVFRPSVTGRPADPFLRDLIAPNFQPTSAVLGSSEQ